MTLERWQQIEEIFQSALERGPESRAAFLDEACAGDAELRAEVESLLAADQEAGSFIEPYKHEGEAEERTSEQSRSIIGQTINDYRVLSLRLCAGTGAEKLCAFRSRIILTAPSF